MPEYEAVNEAREIGKQDMAMVREAVAISKAREVGDLREQRAALVAKGIDPNLDHLPQGTNDIGPVSIVTRKETKIVE